MIKALGPLSHLWEILMQSEVVAKRQGKPQPQLQIDKHLFSCIDMADLLVTALKALGLGISLNFQRRKNNIKPFLDRRYQILCSAKNEVTTNNLLGDNIEQKVSEIYKVSQTTRQTSRAFKPFRSFENQLRRPFYNRSEQGPNHFGRAGGFSRGRFVPRSRGFTSPRAPRRAGYAGRSYSGNWSSRGTYNNTGTYQ